MTPSDTDCPRCKAKASKPCTATQRRFFQDVNGRPNHEETEVAIVYHHAERVDAWATKISARVVELRKLVKP